MFQTTEMEINLGPQHPSTHGVLRVLLKVDGERILESKPVIGYLHRGCEKLGETRPYPQVVVYTDRMDYVAAFAGNLTYIEAVEKLLALDPPPRAKYMRVVLAEMQRIASHLLCLGTHALDIGAMSVFLYCFREREAILDLFEAYCGARLTYNAVRVGGQLNDFPEGWTDDCRRFLDDFPSKIDEYETLLRSNRIWLERTRGIGEIGVYLESDGTDTAYRCRFRSPCFVNLQALPVLVKGHLIADVVTVIGSIDIVLGCVDR